VNRRTFIGRVAGGLLAVPFAVEAQQAGRLPRIGVLLPGNAGVGTESFSQGFRELGYIEGRTAVIEWRWWEGNTERLRDAAAEMRQLNLDVIVVGGSEATKGLEGSNPVNPDRISRAQLSGRGR
jgi:putative tryptophan/tyrosine transport system substrate-binding protein